MVKSFTSQTCRHGGSQNVPSSSQSNTFDLHIRQLGLSWREWLKNISKPPSKFEMLNLALILMQFEIKEQPQGNPPQTNANAWLMFYESMSIHVGPKLEAMLLSPSAECSQKPNRSFLGKHTSNIFCLGISNMVAQNETIECTKARISAKALVALGKMDYCPSNRFIQSSYNWAPKTAFDHPLGSALDKMASPHSTWGTQSPAPGDKKHLQNNSFLREL